MATAFTGQRLDASGLLYYHARMYDPVLGRFVSADSIVPGTASGAGGGAATLGVDSSAQLAPLTVDFHEPGFVSSLNGENGQPFWFRMSDEQRQKASSPWGPANPQALNRYSYGLNNPVKYTDPTGHTVRCYAIIGCIGGVVYNDSPYDVEVTGERRKDTAACRTSTSQSCFETVTATLHQGESSADYGIVDADKVRALDPAHPIDGHGPNDGAYDLIDGQEVHIREKKSDWFEVFLLGGRSWNYGVVLEWRFRPGFAGGAGQYGYYLDNRKPGWTTDPYNKGRRLTDKDKITGR